MSNNSAFSFSRDLPFHFYNLYEISHHLKKSLELSFQQLYDINIKEEKTEVNYPDFADIAKRLSNLDFQFFMDEYYKCTPLIYPDSDKNELILKLDDPWFKPWFKLYTPRVIQVYWLYESDGITEYCAMPYYDYCLKYLPPGAIPKLLKINEID